MVVIGFVLVLVASACSAEPEPSAEPDATDDSAACNRVTTGDQGWSLTKRVKVSCDEARIILVESPGCSITPVPDWTCSREGDSYVYEDGFDPDRGFTATPVS